MTNQPPRGIVTGPIRQHAPLVRCRISNPAQNPDGSRTELSCLAMLDTGASHVCIKPNLLEALGLEPAGQRVQSHVAGYDHESELYRVSVTFDGRSLEDLDYPLWFTVSNAECLVYDTFGPDWDVLIGMNVLSFFELRVIKGECFELRWG